MPLKSGYSSEVIGKNIALEVKRGTPHEQAIAIALDMARREYRKAHLVGPFPHHLKGSGKFYRENPISEKTAHKLRKAAPGTFAKMTDEEIKKAVKVKKKRKKTKKNPVRPLTIREYHVQVSQNKKDWTLVARFKTKDSALEYAKALAKSKPFYYVRVRT